MKRALKVIATLLVLLQSTYFPAFAELEEREFVVINAANGLADNSSQNVVCTLTGRMVVATLGNVNFYDGVSFSHIDTNRKYQFALPKYEGEGNICFDRRHHIWVKNPHSMTCVDLMSEQFVEDVDSVIRTSLECNSLVEDLFVDTLNHVWLLTDDGLYGVEHRKYYAVDKDKSLQDVDVKGNLLYTFYSDGEVVVFDLTSGAIIFRSRPYDDAKAAKYAKASCLHPFNDSFYQVRNGEGGSVVLKFSPRVNEWTVLGEFNYRLNQFTMYNNHLYIACEPGYLTMDMTTGEFVKHSQLSLLDGKKMTPSCNAIAFDKQGGMWIGTARRGVLYSKPTSSPFKVYFRDEPEALRYGALMDSIQQNISQHNGKQANCKLTDSQGREWIGTTAGLFYYEKGSEQPHVITKKEGLLNNVIHAIIEDRSHNIWVSTSCGISCIIFDKGKPVFVNSFDSNDNVPNESFANCKAILLDDGSIAMQSLDHIVVFNPDNFSMVNGRQPFQLFPKLIRINVNGNQVEPNVPVDGNVIIDRAIVRVGEISLNAEQNSVMFVFSGLNYFRPIQTYYRVRVAGIDDNWVVYSHFSHSDLVNQRGMFTLPLLGLQPGEYTLEVEASMFPDIWLDTPYKWIIKVNQPWWRTTGVYMVLVLVLVALLAVNFYFYNRNTKMSARRNNLEGDYIRKIRNFVERCDGYETELLSPSQEDIYSGELGQRSRLDPSFIALMFKIMPYVRQQKDGQLSMHKLSKVGEMDIMEFYDILTANLYKSPHDLVRTIRLQKGADLLATTDMTVEEVANECGFHTPNYFMGNFFHEYKKTPREYREAMKKQP